MACNQLGLLCPVHNGSIVLTTHSMEEADTLCTRIGIMAQGKMRSLGSSTELKKRHGQGYRLSFTLKKEGSEVDEALLHNELCPTAQLIYSFSKSRVYLLPIEGEHRIVQCSALLVCLTPGCLTFPLSSPLSFTKHCLLWCAVGHVMRW